MYDFRPVFAVLSRVLLVFAMAFVVPLAWSIGQDDGLRDVWIYSGLGTGLAGLMLMLATQRFRREMRTRDGFMLVNLVWFVLPAFAAVPLYVAIPAATWVDAYFEAVSGLTATGATVFSGLDGLPVSVNIWRCFLQLFGGLGIMLLVVAILPLLGLGGVQVYKAETPGPMKDSKLTPRVTETARGLWGVYVLLSVGCLLGYRWAGMSWADAFMHMSTTVSLGGFSSKDASLGHFDSVAVESVAMVFMLLAGVSFARYFIVWRARSVLPLWRDIEVRYYVAVLLLAVAVVVAVLLVHETTDDVVQALRWSAFQVLSLATTTGYATTDYGLWPVFAPVLLVFLGCFMSCAGSTGGGIKMVRAILLVKQAHRELVRTIHPRVVNPVTLGGVATPNGVLQNVLAFMLIYGASIVLLSFVMLLSGADIVTALSSVVACVNNIGPGLAGVGPASNFGVLTEFQIWTLTFAMMLGRLEMLSVLVLLTREFWQR